MAFGIKWLKPEIDQFIYYPHILIVGIVGGIVMNKVFGYTSIPLSIEQVSSVGFLVKLGISLTLGDTLAHTLLKLD